MVLLVAAVAFAAGVALAQGPEPDTPPPQEVEQEAPLPAPDGPLPRDAGALADAYAATTDRLLAAIDAWTATGDPATPSDVARLALHRQRIVLHLVRRERRSAAVLRALPRRYRAWLRGDVKAKRELAAIHSVVLQRPKIRIGRAAPAPRLLAHYGRAQRRFEVGWPLLAAVNLVETAFGRMRNESVSGARGPMQFMPATWRAYGLGGNVRRPRDAILGAANLLRANGAPADEARALHAYNPSRLYVRAVSRYARRIRADRRTYYAYHAQQVFLGSERGYRRASSDGL